MLTIKTVNIITDKMTIMNIKTMTRISIKMIKLTITAIKTINRIKIRAIKIIKMRKLELLRLGKDEITAAYNSPGFLCFAYLSQSSA